MIQGIKILFSNWIYINVQKIHMILKSYFILLSILQKRYSSIFYQFWNIPYFSEKQTNLFIFNWRKNTNSWWRYFEKHETLSSLFGGTSQTINFVNLKKFLLQVFLLTQKSFCKAAVYDCSWTGRPSF